MYTTFSSVNLHIKCDKEQVEKSSLKTSFLHLFAICTFNFCSSVYLSFHTFFFFVRRHCLLCHRELYIHSFLSSWLSIIHSFSYTFLVLRLTFFLLLFLIFPILAYNIGTKSSKHKLHSTRYYTRILLFDITTFIYVWR